MILEDTRSEVINGQGVHLAVVTLNCCIKDPEAVCDALKAMRSICSVESFILSSL